MKLMILGSVLLMFLAIAKAMFADALYFLPLGGSSPAEMGIVLGGAYAIATLLELFDKRH